MVVWHKVLKGGPGLLPTGGGHLWGMAPQSPDHLGQAGVLAGQQHGMREWGDGAPPVPEISYQSGQGLCPGAGHEEAHSLPLLH